jgi:hypothetical protein
MLGVEVDEGMWWPLLLELAFNEENLPFSIAPAAKLDKLIYLKKFLLFFY